jgi:hypothetical protein
VVRFAFVLVPFVVFSMCCINGASAQTPPRQGRVLRDAPLRAAPASFSRITGRLAANSTVWALVQEKWCAVLALGETGPAQAVGYVPCNVLALRPAGGQNGPGWKILQREEAGGEARLTVELSSDRAPSREDLAGVLSAAAAGEARDGERVVMEVYLPSMDKDGPGFARASFEDGRLSELILRKSVLMLR